MGLHHHLNVVEFLHDLANRGEEVSLVGEQLHYRARKGTEQRQTVELLRQHKAEITAWLREREASQYSYPLSQGQLGLWLDWQREPTNPMYNLVTVARLHKGVAIEILRQAAQRLVDRHPALRTVYRFVDDQPQQQVQMQQTVDFTLLDGSNWTETAIQQWIEREADRPFDLATGPLMRMSMLQCMPSPLSAGEQADRPAIHAPYTGQAILHWSIHHIAADLFTLETLQKELGICYHALLSGQEPALPPLTLTYRDFVRWEEDALAAQRQQLSSFWQAHLGDTPQMLNLPSPSIPGPEGKPKPGCHTFDFTFDPQLAQQLRLVAQQHGITLYTLLLAAYQVLLSRYSGQETFLISSPTDMRNLPGLTNLVGYLVNPILVRADLQAEADNPLTFATLLQRTQQTVTATMTHQLYPYHAMLQQWRTQLPAQQLQQGLASFVFDTIRQPTTDNNLFAEMLMDGQRGVAGPITLFIFDNQTLAPGQLSGQFVYHAAHFDATFIARMAGHFQTLLTGIVAGATLGTAQRIRDLPLLTEAERYQLLIEWNDTAVEYPKDKCIHHLFEEQAARTPDAVAVVMAENKMINGKPVTLSYWELNARANQLAHYLQVLGIGPEVVVGICVERSIEMVISLLAILKAGGAYLPLDPTYPPERLDFLLEDAAPPVIITQAHYDWLPASAARVVLDQSVDWLAHQPATNPAGHVTPDNLAYIIYTSGSTGKPKGVLLEHKGLTNLAQAQIEAFGVHPGHRVLQVASLNFDASISEIVMTLCTGATLVMATSDALLPGPALTQTVQQQAITHVTLVPTALALLQPETVSSLHTLIVAGEACSAALGARWGAGRHLFNAYGPTESTVCATIMDCAEWLDQQQSPPIGRPIANTQVYVLDRHHQLMPIGVPGELAIGGIGVARGYLKRPELTEARFIANPFGTGRLYKTGDLARWLSDGTIEYLGRLDHQVKIRGFRIELGEIEALLAQHPTVQEAVVVSHPAPTGDPQLIAYVVQREACQCQPDALRHYLLAKVPDYMVPARFMPLPALPLSPNGKIDRKALPVPGGREQRVQHQPPRTRQEQQLLQIASEVLSDDTLSVQDNFFECGGHSLLMVKLLTRIQQNFGRTLPLRILFQHPTVATLATFLQQQEPASTDSPWVALQPNGDKPPFFCVGGIDGNPLYLYALARHLGARQPFYGLQATGLDGEVAPFTTIPAAATHYRLALQRIQPHGPYALGGHSFGGWIAFELAQQLAQMGEHVQMVTIFDSLAPCVLLPNATINDVELMLIYLNELSDRYDRPDHLHYALLAPLSMEERLQHLQHTLETIGYLPNGSDPRLMRGCWQVFSANLRTIYTPKEVIPVPITYFMAEDDRKHPANDESQAIVQAWSQLGQLTLRIVPGTHYTMLAEPHVQTVAQEVTYALTKEKHP